MFNYQTHYRGHTHGCCSIALGQELPAPAGWSVGASARPISAHKVRAGLKKGQDGEN